MVDAPTGTERRLSLRATAGKSTLLRCVRDELRTQGRIPLLVAAQHGNPDIAGRAVVDVVADLQAAGATNGAGTALLTDQCSWREKLGALEDLIKANAGDVVLLLDDFHPGAVRAPKSEAVLFHRRLARELLERLRTTGTRRLVATAQRTRLGSDDDPWTPVELRRWLQASDQWGPLAESAEGVAQRWPEDLNACSPLELRLLVALAELETVPRAINVFRNRVGGHLQGVRAVVSALRDGLRGNELGPLHDAWQRARLVRQPMSQGLLDEVVYAGGTPTERARAIFELGILYPCGAGHWSLHEALRGTADDEQGARRRAPNTHAALAEWYRQQFTTQTESSAAGGGALAAAYEAWHHAVAAGHGEALVEQHRPFFSQQLDELGRTLSLAGRHEQAVSVYRMALQWDESDDYAHHYLAYNLDVQGVSAEEVLRHYKIARDLAPDIPWWHSRLINAHLTLGDIESARSDWELAVSELKHRRGADETYHDELHRWVARLALHRAELELAGQVLGDVPPAIAETRTWWQAMEQLRVALCHAEEDHAVVPLHVDLRGGLRRGPFLLTPRRAGSPLGRWVAGRVDSTVDSTVFLRVAVPPEDSDEALSFGSMEIPFAQFDQRTDGASASELSPGCFVEIGSYDGTDSPVIAVHPQASAGLKGLPRLEPDPQRYLRKAGAVRSS